MNRRSQGVADRKEDEIAIYGGSRSVLKTGDYKNFDLTGGKPTGELRFSAYLNNTNDSINNFGAEVEELLLHILRQFWTGNRSHSRNRSRIYI